MGKIDLKEIPEAHIANGDQDLFELFARDFLEASGFKIIEGPGRGADRGRDLIVEETIHGRISQDVKRWVVSAKHKAHSGKSVSDADEIDPIGRVRKFKADGFMCFYSTLPSSGLDDTLAKIQNEVHVFKYDRGRIEGQLIANPQLNSVFETYLPKSHAACNHDGAVGVWVPDVEILRCCNCDKELLFDKTSIFVHVKELGQNGDPDKMLDVYWCCKGRCDEAFKRQYRTPNTITLWNDIEELGIPLSYMKSVFGLMNSVHSGDTIYTNTAFEKEKTFLSTLSQYVMRPTSPEQWNRITQLKEIPQYLGGLG